jgi:hypothetical protein
MYSFIFYEMFYMHDNNNGLRSFVSHHKTTIGLFTIAALSGIAVGRCYIEGNKGVGNIFILIAAVFFLLALLRLMCGCGCIRNCCSEDNVDDAADCVCDLLTSCCQQD